MFNLNEKATQQKIEELFKLYDKDSSGRLVETEAILFLHKFFQSFGMNLNSDSLNQVRNSISSSSDKKISKNELINVLRQAEQDPKIRELYGVNGDSNNAKTYQGQTGYQQGNKSGSNQVIREQQQSYQNQQMSYDQNRAQNQNYQQNTQGYKMQQEPYRQQAQYQQQMPQNPQYQYQYQGNTQQQAYGSQTGFQGNQGTRVQNGYQN